MGYIYLITNKLTGKKYIGQTLENDIHERWKSHFKKSSNCRYLKHALAKYHKENFKFEIICICFDTDCDKYEKEYIKKFNTLVPNGYNLREGGNNGRHNTETKKKISNTLRSKWSNLSESEKKKHSESISGPNNHQFGKKRTPEEREKMRFNRKDLKKVNCYNLKGEFVATFISIGEAARKTNTDGRNISKCCKGIGRTSNGFIWKFI